MVSGEILLVDDNEVNRMIAGAMLEKRQLSYSEATDGQDAITQWLQGQFKLILMDCHMPNIDGLDATRQIREREGKGQHIPIIAITASTSTEYQKKCSAAGMDDYLAKPFQETELQAVLDKWLLNPKGHTNTLNRSKTMSEGNFIEQQILDNLLQFLPEDKLHGLLSCYIDDSKKLIQQMKDALASSDAAETRRLVHSLKSTSANIGAMPISEMAKQLEQLAQEEKLDEVRSQYPELTKLFEQTRDALQQLPVMLQNKAS